MIQRFSDNERVRVEAISEQVMVGSNLDLAREIDRCGELILIPKGTAFIEQDGEDNEVYLILAGVADIIINGRTIAKRGPGVHVGEMAAVQPTQKRSATCLAAEDIVAVKLSEAHFSELATRYPVMYRAIARELSLNSP